MVTATFRYYEELNDFLAPARRKREFSVPCARRATTKHMIEALGVPHTEVEPARRHPLTRAFGDSAIPGGPYGRAERPGLCASSLWTAPVAFMVGMERDDWVDIEGESLTKTSRYSTR